MKQNCGSLKFFLKVVTHRYYSVFLVSEWVWHTYCDGLLHVQVLCQDAICCLYEDSSMLDVMQFRLMFLCIDTSISEECAAFIFRVVQEPTALP